MTVRSPHIGYFRTVRHASHRQTTSPPAACVAALSSWMDEGPSLSSHAHHVRRIRVRPHEVAASAAFTHGLALATKPAPVVAADGTDEALRFHVSQSVPAGCGSPARSYVSVRLGGEPHPERRGPLHWRWSTQRVSAPHWPTLRNSRRRLVLRQRHTRRALSRGQGARLGTGALCSARPNCALKPATFSERTPGGSARWYPIECGVRQCRGGRDQPHRLVSAVRTGGSGRCSPAALRAPDDNATPAAGRHPAGSQRTGHQRRCSRRRRCGGQRVDGSGRPRGGR